MYRLSARNQFPGKVLSVEKGAVNAIVKLEVLGGNVITATISYYTKIVSIDFLKKVCSLFFKFKYAIGVLAARRALRRSYHLRASAIRRRLHFQQGIVTPAESCIFFQSGFLMLPLYSPCCPLKIPAMYGIHCISKQSISDKRVIPISAAYTIPSSISVEPQH